MENLGYYNGKTARLDEMLVPMCDRAFYFGDGIYDVAYANNHVVYALEEHVDKFFEYCEGVAIRPNFSRKDLIDLLRALVLIVDAPSQSVYWQLSRGTALRSHAYGEMKPNLAVMIKPCSVNDLSRPVAVQTCQDVRHGYCACKTLNLLPNVLASTHAADAGCFEAVFVKDGIVTECAHSNIFILIDNTLVTHPADETLLSGVARRKLIELYGEMGGVVRQKAFGVNELMSADEVIITAAGAMCLAVNEVDGNRVGGGAPDVLAALQKAVMDDFYAATGGENRRREENGK